MSTFTTNLKVEILEEGKKFELLEEFEYYRQGAETEIFQVHKGFITDFASIPRPFWNFYPPLGYGKKCNYGKSAVLHDFLYSYVSPFTRKECDKLFYESMRAVGVKKITALIFYASVRLFGGHRFKKKENKFKIEKLEANNKVFYSRMDN